MSHHPAHTPRKTEIRSRALSVRRPRRRYSLLALALTPVMLATMVSSGVVGATRPAEDVAVTAATAVNPLAIDLPARRTHKKRVFAHYFSPYPISLDNRRPANDYYARNYLKAGGEKGKYAAWGGLLRDRPVGRAPLTGNWKLADAKTEIRQAVAAGLDGFMFDVLSLSGTHWDRLRLLMTAAESVDPGFKIALMPDMTSSTGVATAGVLASRMATLAARPSAYRLATKELVVSPFKAENKTPAWWAGFKNIMVRKHGIKVAFWPVFLNASANMRKFASISYGFGIWGARNPGSIRSQPNYALAAHKLGKKWMAPIAVQDMRPTQAIYDEAGNTDTLRASWSRALNDGADAAQVITWNDYYESTSFAPSAGHGYTFLDINTYFQTAFQTGRYRPTVRDALYLTHRKQDYRTMPSTRHKVVKLRAGKNRTAARNTVEIYTILVAPARITIKVGATVYKYMAAAGPSGKRVRLAPGAVSASATRTGRIIAAVTSKYPVKSAVSVQDLQYVGTASRR